jgi:hypothetical protein
MLSFTCPPLEGDYSLFDYFRRGALFAFGNLPLCRALVVVGIVLLVADSKDLPRGALTGRDVFEAETALRWSPTRVADSVFDITPNSQRNVAAQNSAQALLVGHGRGRSGEFCFSYNCEIKRRHNRRDHLGEFILGRKQGFVRKVFSENEKGRMHHDARLSSDVFAYVLNGGDKIIAIRRDVWFAIDKSHSVDDEEGAFAFDKSKPLKGSDDSEYRSEGSYNASPAQHSALVSRHFLFKVTYLAGCFFVALIGVFGWASGRWYLIPVGIGAFVLISFVVTHPRSPLMHSSENASEN